MIISCLRFLFLNVAFCQISGTVNMWSILKFMVVFYDLHKRDSA
jgi:hypothetical protein